MVNPLGSAFRFVSSFSFLQWNTGIQSENGVLILTSGNFKEVVNQNELLIVQFYMRQCPHCKAFRPEFEKLKKLLNAENSKVKLGQVDGQVEKALIWKNNIMVYPTIRLFKNGKQIEYYGEQKAELILQWLNKNCPNHYQ